MPDGPPKQMPLRKVLKDQLRFRFGKKVRRFSEQAGAPLILMLESSAACNLSCTKCAHKSVPRKRGNMDLELAFSVIDQAVRMGTKWVCMSMLGEPLLHPELEKITEHVRQTGAKPYMVTNGMLLTPERSRGLLDAGLNGLVVSIDGWDPESYKERQKGAEPDTVMRNLAEFKKSAARKEPTPETISISIADTVSIKHLRQIKSYIGPAVDRCGVLPLMDFGIPEHRPDPALLLGRKSWMFSPCRNLWETLNVGWDGRVTACCNDHGFLLEYGDAKDSPLEEIWNNRTMRLYRKNHLDKRLGDMPMCGDCTQDFEKSLSFSLLRYRFAKM